MTPICFLYFLPLHFQWFSWLQANSFCPLFLNLTLNYCQETFNCILVIRKCWPWNIYKFLFSKNLRLNLENEVFHYLAIKESHQDQLLALTRLNTKKNRLIGWRINVSYATLISLTLLQLNPPEKVLSDHNKRH